MVSTIRLFFLVKIFCSLENITNFTADMTTMSKKLVTIKVLPETVQKLNFISAHNDKKQYEIVDMLANKEKNKIIKAIKKP